MKKWTVHTGRGCPLRRSHVDTDQIIPAEFCKRITRTGYADALFAQWRDRSDYPLSRPEYVGASILIASDEFGIGSSREHAVWALRDHGFVAVLATSFGDIFRANASRNGLLTAAIDAKEIAALWEVVERQPASDITIDLAARTIRCASVDMSFAIPEQFARRLLAGIDDIAETLQHDDDIRRYEAGRHRFLPRTSPRTTEFTARSRRLQPMKLMELLMLARRHGAIDLATGTPAFPETSDEAVEAAIAALRGGFNQYSSSAGTAELRTQAARLHHADPDTEITITAGATEGLNTVLGALIQPGDEVVVLDPHYETFSAAVALAGGNVRFVKLHPPAWRWREDELTAAFGPRTRAVILNSPHNPTGRMFSTEEIRQIVDLCAAWNVALISDEVYAAYAIRGGDGALPSEVAQDITLVTLRSMSKSHAISGWRIGWIHAGPALTERFRLVHETLTACVATPLQLAAAADLSREPGISKAHLQTLDINRLRLSKQLTAMGMTHLPLESRCYLYARLPDSRAGDATGFTRSLIEEVGVAAAPGPLFHSDPSEGQAYVRFSLNKTEDMITEAIVRISALEGEVIPAPIDDENFFGTAPVHS